MYSREDSVIGAYKEPENKDTWLICPKCEDIPWIWRFDNGCYAKCRCHSKYEGNHIRAESVNSYAKRMNGNMTDYSSDNLRIAWNDWVRTGIVKPLEERQW